MDMVELQKIMIERGLSSCGQCQDTIRAGLETVLNIWDRWHLNGLNAGCKHQKTPSAGGDWKQKYAEETAKCPNGYNYGSKWLVEPLPREVMDRVVAIFNKYEEVF